MPTFNRWDRARESVRRLLASDYPLLRVIVVAHGCTDGTVERCRAEFPDVSVVVGGGDLWWGGAINLGTREALRQPADFVLWINDDNWIAPDAIRALARAGQTSGPRSVVASRVGAAEGEEWVGQPSPLEILAGAGPVEPNLRGDLVPLRHPPGGQGVLLPRSCFDEIGFVDEARFPHYWGDHDFHYRAMAAGFRYFLCAGAAVQNRPNARSERSPFIPSEMFRLVFGRSSAINVFAVWRLLHYSLTPDHPTRLFVRWLRGTLYWLATGYINRHPRVHWAARTLRRSIAHLARR